MTPWNKEVVVHNGEIEVTGRFLTLATLLDLTFAIQAGHTLAVVAGPSVSRSPRTADTSGTQSH